MTNETTRVPAWLGPLLRTVWLCAICLMAGAWLHQHFRGSVRIYTYVNEGTAMNHGQRTVSIELPAGIIFTSFGRCGPGWKRDGSGFSWDTLEADEEIFDQRTQRYIRKPLFP